VSAWLNNLDDTDLLRARLGAAEIRAFDIVTSKWPVEVRREELEELAASMPDQVSHVAVAGYAEQLDERERGSEPRPHRSGAAADPVQSFAFQK
jgi:hypothetical protein